MNIQSPDRERQSNAARYQTRMRRNPTKAEQAVKAALDVIGVKYYWQKMFLREKTARIVDFYISKMQLCIEVDGKYHEKQKSYDDYREEQLKKQRRNLKFLRVTNEWVLSQNNLPAALLAKLEAIK